MSVLFGICFGGGIQRTVHRFEVAVKAIESVEICSSGDIQRDRQGLDAVVKAFDSVGTCSSGDILRGRQRLDVLVKAIESVGICSSGDIPRSRLGPGVGARSCAALPFPQSSNSSERGEDLYCAEPVWRRARGALGVGTLAHDRQWRFHCRFRGPIAWKE